MSARDAMRMAVRRLLIDGGVSQSALARKLTEAARQYGLKRGDSVKEVRYDPAMVNRWLDGKLVMSRQAAWLLDQLYPRAAGEETFQDLRDRYLLSSDRAQVPEPAPVRDRPLLEGARCSAELLASRHPHRRQRLADDETMAFTLLSVVDCEEARQIIAELVAATEGVRLIAMYDVLGHWDVAVKLVGSAGFDLVAFQDTLHDALVANEMADPVDASGADDAQFTGHRATFTDGSRIRRPDGSADPPSFLVLDSPEDYDLLRVQRAFLFVELKSVPTLRRGIAQRQIERLISGEDMPRACRQIVEAVTTSDDSLILEIVLTCANGVRRLNQLNRLVGRELTRFKAQKYNLIVFTSDEREWVAEAGALHNDAKVSAGQ